MKVHNLTAMNATYLYTLVYIMYMHKPIKYTCNWVNIFIGRHYKNHYEKTERIAPSIGAQEKTVFQMGRQQRGLLCHTSVKASDSRTEQVQQVVGGHTHNTEFSSKIAE